MSPDDCVAAAAAVVVDGGGGVEDAAAAADADVDEKREVAFGSSWCREWMDCCR